MQRRDVIWDGNFPDEWPPETDGSHVMKAELCRINRDILELTKRIDGCARALKNLAETL